MNKHAHNNRGFALLLALIISSVVLAIGLTMLSVAIKQLNLSATGRESEIAFQMANLGMECGRYWRTQLAAELLNQNSTNADFQSAGISCAGSSAVFPASPAYGFDGDVPGLPSSDGYQNRLRFQFDTRVGNDPVVANNNRCVDVEIHVISASDDIVNHDVGRIQTDCAQGDTCTVVIAQGYNKSCAAISSIFSVQRELTAEF
jgi:hypothetical protein